MTTKALLSLVVVGTRLLNIKIMNEEEKYDSKKTLRQVINNPYLTDTYRAHLKRKLKYLNMMEKIGNFFKQPPFALLAKVVKAIHNFFF